MQTEAEKQEIVAGLNKTMLAMGLDPSKENEWNYGLSIIRLARTWSLSEAQLRKTLIAIAETAPIVEADLLATFKDLRVEELLHLKERGLVARVVIGYQHSYWACTPEGFDVYRAMKIEERG